MTVFGSITAKAMPCDAIPSRWLDMPMPKTCDVIAPGGGGARSLFDEAWDDWNVACNAWYDPVVSPKGGGCAGVRDAAL